MNTNIRKILLICSISPLLMAVLCEKVDDLPSLIYSEAKVTLSEGPIFSISDTLWISGEVSSMIYDEGAQDSIMNSNEAIRDIISILRLKSANGNSNTIEAINEFEIVTRVGSIDFLGACPESELIAIAPLTESGQSYMYEIALIPKSTGDFVLSWLEPVNLRNSVLNTQILEKYPVNGDENYLGLTKCGITSTISDVKESKDEFFFLVN